MMRARHALGPIAALWLICQAATLTLVPVLGWLGSTGAAACTCTNGAADAMCPMHHKAATAGTTVCTLQSATTNPVAALNAFLGVVGVVPVSQRATMPTPAASRVLLTRSVATARPTPPDPPPPRA